MLNPIFWKKVQGQKHPGMWGIIEHQIPSIKVLFKTNAQSHKHPCIKLLSSESKTQLVNQTKRNSYRRAYIYIFINTELLDGNKGHQEETHHPTHRLHSNSSDQEINIWTARVEIWCATGVRSGPHSIHHLHHTTGPTHQEAWSDFPSICRRYLALFSIQTLRAFIHC